MTGQAKISVIIPVYQVGPYLDRCLASVCGQTETDMEILCVYTRSTDGTLEKLRAWADRDARVRILRRDDGGLGGARNVGLDHARGRYIAFVDSDDWIDKNMFELLYRMMLEHHAQIAECSYRSFFPESVQEETPCTGACIESDAAQAISGMMDWKNFKAVVWNKLYAREVIGDIRFPENRLCEDEYTTYKFFCNAKRLVYLDVSKYNYDRTREDSLTNKKFNENNLDGCFALRERIDYLCEHGLEELEEKAINLYAWVVLDRLYLAYKNNTDGAKVRQTVKMIQDDIDYFKKRPIYPSYLEDMICISEKGLHGYGVKREAREEREKHA